MEFAKESGRICTLSNCSWKPLEKLGTMKPSGLDQALTELPASQEEGAGGVAQLEECLPGICEAMGFILSSEY